MFWINFSMFSALEVTCSTKHYKILFFNMIKQQKIEMSIEFSSQIYRKDKKDT